MPGDLLGCVRGPHHAMRPSPPQLTCPLSPPPTLSPPAADSCEAGDLLVLIKPGEEPAGAAGDSSSGAAAAEAKEAVAA